VVDVDAQAGNQTAASFAQTEMRGGLGETTGR
jgi:hypothetical protein